MTTVLDAAYAALLAGGEAEAMAFYRSLADAELFVLLEAEAKGEALTPRVYDLESGPVLLVFDIEERLAGFADQVLPYAVLPGRVIAGQLAGQGFGLGLNLGSGSASEVILPGAAMDWLATMLDQAAPETLTSQVARFEPPAVPALALAALSGVLGGVAQAWLAGVQYADGRRGQMLVLSGVAEEAEVKTARAITEALTFSGLEAAALDVVFAASDDAILERLAGVALTFGGTGAAALQSEPLEGAGIDRSGSRPGVD